MIKGKKLLCGKVLLFVAGLLFMAAIPSSFAQPPGMGVHHKEAMESAKAMLDHGEQAIEQARKGANSILPNDIRSHSKAMIDHANMMIDKTEEFIKHLQAAMDARDASKVFHEHGIESIKNAREAIHHQREAIKHAEAAVKSHLNIMDAKQHANQSKEHTEDAQKQAIKAYENVKEPRELPGPGPAVPPPPFRPPFGR